MNPNATIVERLQYYVDNDQYEQAEALAAVADYLEDCFTWDIAIDPDAQA